MSHSTVLAELGCNDLYELVDTHFLKEFKLDRPEQYGMVCKNVKEKKSEASCSSWVQVPSSTQKLKDQTGLKRAF